MRCFSALQLLFKTVWTTGLPGIARHPRAAILSNSFSERFDETARVAAGVIHGAN